MRRIERQTPEPELGASHFADAQIALQVGQGDHEEDAKEQQQDDK